MHHEISGYRYNPPLNRIDNVKEYGHLYFTINDHTGCFPISKRLLDQRTGNKKIQEYVDNKIIEMFEKDRPDLKAQ